MKGTYVLVMKLSKGRRIKIGKFGRFYFPPGYYAYVGSAFGPGGIKSRVKRHLRSKKKFHWHIDYFLKFGKIISVYAISSRSESEISNRLLKFGCVVAEGFGSSDTKDRTHLIFFKNNPEKFLNDMKRIFPSDLF